MSSFVYSICLYSVAPPEILGGIILGINCYALIQYILIILVILILILYIKTMMLIIQ